MHSVFAYINVRLNFGPAKRASSALTGRKHCTCDRTRKAGAWCVLEVPGRLRRLKQRQSRTEALKTVKVYLKHLCIAIQRKLDAYADVRKNVRKSR
jgi:hypothetical protein